MEGEARVCARCEQDLRGRQWWTHGSVGGEVVLCPSCARPERLESLRKLERTLEERANQRALSAILEIIPALTAEGVPLNWDNVVIVAVGYLGSRLARDCFTAREVVVAMKKILPERDPRK